MDIKNYRDLNLEDATTDDDEAISDCDTWIERFFLAILSIIPGLVALSFRKSYNVSFVYASVHALQSVGSIGFGYNVDYWANILNFIFILAGFYFLIVRICAPLTLDLWHRLVMRQETLSIGETCGLWYFGNTMITLSFIHGVVSTVKLYDWTSYNSWDLNIFVYSFALYSIINSTVPGRLAKFALDREKNKMVQTKRSLIRYMSHEVRSPLNVIYSGLNLLVGDVKKMPSFAGKANLVETFTSIRQASDDLLQTMNNLLLLESMDSAAFSIDAHIVPCSKLTQIAEKSSVLAREKGIDFVVNNQFGESILNSISEETANPASPEEVSEVLSIFIDEFKIGQVMRNLISNSAKFTPAGQSIAVNIRTATSADLIVELEDKDKDKDKGDDKKARTPVEQDGYTLSGHVIIEVKDTGVGIAPEHRQNMFQQFSQFDASKLQGGGGFGLGLWICQQIVSLHGSAIQFHSDGENCGTRFFFTLPCYKKIPVVKTNEEVMPPAAPPSALPLPVDPFTLLTGSIRGVQISPESLIQSGSDPTAAVTDKFSSIVPRPLRNHGVCKVLMVDDSKFNVKIMRKLVQQVSATRPSPPPTPTSQQIADTTGIIIGTDDTAAAVVQQFPQQEEGRSSAYTVDISSPSSSSPSPPPRGKNILDRVVVFDYSEADDGKVAVQMVQAARLIIGVTGNVMVEDVKHYIQSGADYVLGKPVNVSDLKQILQKLE
eukprot:gene27606-36408_t